MKRLDDLISMLKEFDTVLISIIERAVKENEGTIININTDVQLYEQGVNRLNEKIADYRPYRPLTIQIKQAKNQPTNRVTLKDTGDFHSSFYIEYQSDGFEIKATDEKTLDLVGKYGWEIFGLTDKSIHDVAIDYILPDLIKYLKEKL